MSPGVMTASSAPSGPLTPRPLAVLVRVVRMLAEAPMEGIYIPVPSTEMLLEFHSGVMLDSYGRALYIILRGLGSFF